MERSLRLIKLFGIPIQLHYTWFALFILITFSLSHGYFPLLYKGWALSVYWTVGIIASLLFFASLIVHELTHSLISLRYGIPVKSITLFIFGGVARIVREARRPGEELLIAISGPLSSLGLGALFYLAWQISWPLNQPSGALFYWLMRVNILLALFNLIPGFPLDGGRVFRSLLWRFSGEYRKATQIAFLAGEVVGWLFILGGVVIALFLRLIPILWLSLIGGFLLYAIRLSRRHNQLRENLSGLTALRVMDRGVTFVSPQLTLSQLYQDYMLTTGQYYFAVGEAEQFLGIIQVDQLKSIPRDLWSNTPVSKIMTPAHKLPTASPEQEAITILEKMLEEKASLIPILHQNKLLGIATKENLLLLAYYKSL